MELYTLHPLPDLSAARFLQLITNEHSADGNTAAGIGSQFWFKRIVRNADPKPNDISFGLAGWLSTQQPVFARQGLSLSSWEARVDRGAGMYLRPPSRLFIGGGLNPVMARAMPIRIEGGDAMMGGAWVPAGLMETYLERLDTNLERSVRRLNEAELDGATLFGVMYEAARYASSRGMGLYEAVDLLDATDPGSWPPNTEVVNRSYDKSLADRIQVASTPPKEPGIFARILGRKRT